LAKIEGQLQEMNRKESYLENKLGDLDSVQENIGDNIYKLISEYASGALPRFFVFPSSAEMQNGN